MSDNPHKAPVSVSGEGEARRPIMGHVIAIFAAGALMMGMLLLSMIGFVLSSPILNDSSTWPVEMEWLLPAIGFLVCSFCLFKAASLFEKNSHWSAWLLGGISIFGAIVVGMAC